MTVRNSTFPPSTLMLKGLSMNLYTYDYSEVKGFFINQHASAKIVVVGVCAQKQLLRLNVETIFDNKQEHIFGSIA